MYNSSQSEIVLAVAERILVVAIAIVAVVLLFSLAGCANFGQVLDNLDKDCTRHYDGMVTNTPIPVGSFTFKADCVPSGQTPAPAPPGGGP